LLFKIKEKENDAIELIIANKDFISNEEKEKQSAELCC
jgi:hypothetical protein